MIFNFSNKEGRLLAPHLLRTAHESFPSYGYKHFTIIKQDPSTIDEDKFRFDKFYLLVEVWIRKKLRIEQEVSDGGKSIIRCKNRGKMK